MAKKPGFTKDMHFAAGAGLGRLDRLLWQVKFEITHAYGSRSKQARMAKRAYDSIVKAREELQQVANEELGGEADQAYFGRGQTSAGEGNDWPNFFPPDGPGGILSRPVEDVSPPPSSPPSP